MCVLERNFTKCEQVRNFGQNMVFKALYLMIEASYHVFDTFLTKTKDKTFT